MINNQNLFQTIKDNSEKLLGSFSMELFSIFMSGYKHAQLDFGNQSEEISGIPIEFHQWVCQKLKVKNKNLSWAITITLFSATEIEAFDLFINLFSEFSCSYKQLSKGRQEQEYSNKLSKRNLEDLITEIKFQPAIYLRIWSISRMYAFLNGYLKACEDFNFCEEIKIELNNFDLWLGKEIERKTYIYPKCSWHKMLLLFYPDEKTALEQFFIYYDKYCELSAKKVDEK